jgi:SecD/SecF fusion protein
VKIGLCGLLQTPIFAHFVNKRNPQIDMQLKGLVRVFAILLIAICLYELSLTWAARSHESSIAEKAKKQANAMLKTMPSPTAEDSQTVLRRRMTTLLDSTKYDNVWLGVASYQYCKDQELRLGLDLQGGMNVTMEVSQDEVLKILAGYSKDQPFLASINEANAAKGNSGEDFISLFLKAYNKNKPGAKLANLFAGGSNKQLTYNSSDAEVVSYLRATVDKAVENTYRIIGNRIDRFGVANPTINLDKAKSIITVELAGVTDAKRIRDYLQAGAKLQFFEVYNISELYSTAWEPAEKALADYNAGTKVDTVSKDTTPTVAKTDTSKKDTTDPNKLTDAEKKAKYPLSSIVQISQPQQDKGGNVVYPAELGYIAKKDTPTLNAFMAYDFVRSKFPTNAKILYGKPFVDDKGQERDFLPVYVIKTIDGERAELEGEHVSDAKQDYDSKGKVAVLMQMDKVGEKTWAKMTGRNVGRPIAVVLDNIVQTAPNVNSAITGGNSEITGGYSITEAQDLADILKSGRLDAPAKIVQEQVVGPTLGQETVKGGMMAFVISFLIIFGLMLIYYNTSGWVANIALIFNLLFTVGILASLHATLTAPGIAALVLTVGLAVDTNVIIFERIKEELTKGKSYLAAVDEGYKRSLPPVLDAHVTTLLTAFILYYFGLGPVKGFATTQILGIILSLFCGILLSRLITDIFTGKQKHLEYFTGISKRVFKHSAFKFIEYRKVGYAIFGVVTVLGIAAMFHGFDQGVEFKGGRSYTVKLAKNATINNLRESLKPVFEESPIVKTIGTGNQVNITTSYLINKQGKDVDAQVEAKLFEGLKAYLPEGTSFDAFEKQYKMSSQTVLPTISDDLKSGAKWATFISILIICFYIFIRFRDWRYSLGTIVALLHDVFVTLAVFSFGRHLNLFPMELDQHFIAAVLTVIGFSMNDTVIVFDRIREYSKTMRNATKTDIINKAINDTLSRTIMTSLTVFITVLVLFIFGGEVTRGFAFAMLIGVITGTYSSIFVAAPILVDVAKDKPLGEAELTTVAKKA